MKKQNKYTYLYVIQGNYSMPGYANYGFEDVDASEDYADIKMNLRLYRENEKGATFRLIQRRELNNPTT